MSTDQLPDYAAELDYFHRSFEAELAETVRLVVTDAVTKVLDVGCGDGFYTGLIAKCLGPSGSVYGFDDNRAFLERARRRLRSTSAAQTFIEGDLFEDSLPRDGFDLVWCAQSLYSLPEPIAALRRMAELTRPGGAVAVLENDTLHQLLLPWPCDLEIAVRTAEHAAFVAQSKHPDKYYIGRRLPKILAEAGWEPTFFQTRSIDRSSPITDSLRHFLIAHLRRLEKRVRPFLDRPMLSQFDDYVQPTGHRFFLDDPHFTLTWVNVLAMGRRV